jgi:hypothetical protein
MMFSGKQVKSAVAPGPRRQRARLRISPECA